MHSQPPWKLERLCSESQLSEIAHELWLALRNVQSVTRRAVFVSLEGEMGAGKSTFARALLRLENPTLVFKGSPTFALAHEYAGAEGMWIHTDLYRMKSEDELREAGIEAFFWEREKTVILVEWLSLFEGMQRALIAECTSGERAGFRVRLDFVEGGPDQRRVCIENLG